MIKYLTLIGFTECASYSGHHKEEFPCAMLKGYWYYRDEENKRFYRYINGVSLICVCEKGDWSIIGENQNSIEMALKEMLREKRLNEIL